MPADSYSQGDRSRSLDSQHWRRNEQFRDVLVDLASALHDEDAIDESECLIDATFASAKGGGDEIGPTLRGKGMEIMAMAYR